MRLFIFLAIVLLLDVYAFQSVRVLMQPFSQTVRAVLYGLYALLSVGTLFYLYMAFTGQDDTWPRAVQSYARAFAFILIVAKLFPIIFLLLDDIRRVLGWLYSKTIGSGEFVPSRKRFFSQAGLLIGALPFTTLSYGVLRNPYRYKLYSADVPINNLPDELEGLKIVQISDVHSGSFFFKAPLQNAIDLINAQEPDLVLFTGDLVNEQAQEMEPYTDIFGGIRSKYGIYSVLGNHDYGDYHRWPSEQAKAENMQRLEELQAQMGWKLLRNTHDTVTINGHSIDIIGIENSSALPHFRTYGDLEKAATNSQSAVKILLSHDPSYWMHKVVKEFKDIQLTLSGHTHGFQFGIEIPGFVKWSPSKWMYKQWAGLYSEGQQHLYVNRGLGFLGYPGRVGILPEVTLLRLNKA